MILETIFIEDYKSIKNLTWNLNESLTCLVGQNESGKSNLMEIFDFIENDNFDNLRFDKHTNRSSPRYIAAQTPSITLEYSLKSNTRKQLINEISKLGQIIETTLRYMTKVRITYPSKTMEVLTRLDNNIIKNEGLSEEIKALILNTIRLNGSKVVTLKTTSLESFSMRIDDLKNQTDPDASLLKILKIAGGDPTNLPSDKMAIRIFLNQLTKSLDENFTKKYYLQDNSVSLSLEHDSGDINLYISDDSGAEYSINERSLGFRYFFCLLIEAAIQKENHQDIIFVLDEPGNNLHPSGQRDLLRYFEELSKQHRLIYTTHSPFLINRLYPNRVKLVQRTKLDGTLFQLKGFAKNWKPLRSALGLNLSDSFYYSERALIVEGPEDVIYLSSLLNFFIRESLIEVNTDIFSFIDAGGESNLLPMIQIMIQEERPLMVFMDSDVPKTFKKLIEKQKKTGDSNLIITQVSEIKQDAISIEDLLPIDLLISATNNYISELVDDSILTAIPITEDNKFVIPENANSIYKTHISSYVKKNYKCAERSQEEWKNEKVPISKVGIAKCFDLILSGISYKTKEEEFAPSLKLISKIINSLNLSN